MRIGFTGEFLCKLKMSSSLASDSSTNQNGNNVGGVLVGVCCWVFFIVRLSQIMLDEIWKASKNWQ